MANKTNKQTAAKVAAGAKQENKVINTNPGYIFRSLNKKAQGRDADAKQVEGYSRESLKELFTRLENTFSCGGFWWGSVYAFNGRLVTSAVAVKQGVIYSIADNKVVFSFAGNSYIGTLAKEWSENAVIDAAKVRLNLVEQYAQAIDKAQEQERKEQERKEQKEQKAKERKQASKERKQKKEQAQELAKTIQELKEQVAAGTLSQDQAFAKVQELMAA
jgi:hypothetical protein